MPGAASTQFSWVKRNADKLVSDLATRNFRCDEAQLLPNQFIVSEALVERGYRGSGLSRAGQQVIRVVGAKVGWATHENDGNITQSC